ncbi:MAG: outer membrane lipoprotein carrier protein LolA [Deltaproteobacteria bacterium]|jgi:outer membrane lipoprotein-sorting protein|nr:outer membrane lipoprotein carrier protein LolA [Deltaproteobacteria bacterium]
MASKITIISLILLTAILFIAAPLFAIEPKPISDSELNQLLENVEKNFSKVKTLRTQLIQEKNISLFSETITSTGLCIFKSPNKLRLDFIKPFKSSLIINNNQIFKYEFFNGSWQKLNTGNEEMMLLIMENITSWLQGRFKNPDLYKIRAFKNEKVSVLLTPKADEFKKFVSSFELGLNRGMNGLDYIIINETKNNYTKIQFHNDEINKEIPDIIFEGSNDKPHSVPQW